MRSIRGRKSLVYHDVRKRNEETSWTDTQPALISRLDGLVGIGMASHQFPEENDTLVVRYQIDRTQSLKH